MHTKQFILNSLFFPGKSKLATTKFMDWIRRRRGPEWKQSRTSQTLSSISTPPIHLLAIFAIVILLLSFSHQADYKDQIQRNVQFISLMLPFLLVIFIGYLLMNGGIRYFQHSSRPLLVSGAQSQMTVNHRSEAAAVPAGGSFPWGVAALVILILVLLSYQSSFQWFGPSA